MAEKKHDDWLSGLGIDVDQLRQAVVGTGAPAFNPSLDPSALPGLIDTAAQLAPAVIDTGVQFAKSFSKGIGEEGQAFNDSPAVRAVTGPAVPIANILGQAIDAVVTGDPSKIDPVKAFTPPSTIGPIDLNDPAAALAKADDPVEQQKAIATVEGLKDLVVDPVGTTGQGLLDTGKLILTGDPQDVGERAGRATFRTAQAVGFGLAGVGELAGVGAIEDAGAVGAAVDTGAAGDVGGAGAAVDTGAAGEGGAARGAADAGAVKASPLAQTSGGPGEPPPTFDPQAPGSAGSDPNAGPFGDPGPFTPRAPSSGPATDPAPPDLPPDTQPNPPFDNPPPSSPPPGLNDPSPPPSLRPEGPPGFPFGEDPPDAVASTQRAGPD